MRKIKKFIKGMSFILFVFFFLVIIVSLFWTLLISIRYFIRHVDIEIVGLSLIGLIVFLGIFAVLSDNKIDDSLKNK